jgi:2-phosphosulfolactate phosphatase
LEQSRYQIRFDWGIAGANAIAADADVIVWVDAITDAPTPEIESVPASGAMIAANFASARAAAQWTVGLQKDLGQRIVIAVVAAGAPRPPDQTRFAVEDLLAAGSVIASLGEFGLDATSPEAAAAEAAYLGLSRAVGHLVSASVSAVADERGTGPIPTRIDHNLSADDVRVLRSRS